MTKDTPRIPGKYVWVDVRRKLQLIESVGEGEKIVHAAARLGINYGNAKCIISTHRKNSRKKGPHWRRRVRKPRLQKGLIFENEQTRRVDERCTDMPPLKPIELDEAAATPSEPRRLLITIDLDSERSPACLLEGRFNRQHVRDETQAKPSLSHEILPYQHSDSSRQQKKRELVQAIFFGCALNSGAKPGQVAVESEPGLACSFYERTLQRQAKIITLPCPVKLKPGESPSNPFRYPISIQLNQPSIPVHSASH